jgi:cation transport ATPase
MCLLFLSRNIEERNGPGGQVGSSAVSDSLKPEAIETVASLHEAGKQVWILTGDNRLCAEAVAAELGISPAQVWLGVESPWSQFTSECQRF